MENFIVSARKYRPVTFDSVVGQVNITTTLKNAIKNNHLAQAFLFCGPRGVGKTTCARILAKTINCQNVKEGIEACDQCESCVSFNSSHSFNIHELDAASNNGVDEIRNIIDQVRIAPQVGKYSVYIIDEVHMLSASAFNAFLKTLEEPPPYAIFILATTSKQKIIPTILSRCQIYDFNRISTDDIAKHLGFVAEKEGVELEQDAAHVIGQKADGSLRDSLSIFDQIVNFAGNKVNYKTVIENLNILDYDYYFKVMKAIVKHDIPTVLTVLDEILENGFDGHNFITGLSEHFRNLLVCKDEGMIQLLEVGEGIKEKYQTQADQCEQRFLINALSIANKCDVNYNHNVNKRLNIELALLQLCSLGLAGVELQPAKYSIADPPEDTAPKKAEEPTPEYKRRQEPPTKEAKTDINPIEPAEEEKRSKESKEREEEKTAGVQEEKPVEEKVDQEPEQKTQSKGTTRKESSPAEEKPQDTENMRKHRLTSHTISINPEIDQETVENKDSFEPTDHNADGLTLSEIETTVFLDAWDSFSKKLYESGKHSLCSTLTKRKPIVKPNNMVELPIDNIVQETEVNEIKTELQEYLKESLGLSKVKVITTIVKDEKTKKPYTALEKFNRMVEKNPSIDQLREQLGLDLD